jgi:hypothetical protein
MGKAEAALYALEIVTGIGIVLLVRASARIDVLWSAALIAVAAVWLVVNGPLEGRTLWTMTGGHGLTSGDFLALPSLGIALALLARYRGSRRRISTFSASVNRSRYRR